MEIHCGDRVKEATSAWLETGVNEDRIPQQGKVAVAGSECGLSDCGGSSGLIFLSLVRSASSSAPWNGLRLQFTSIS